MNRKITDPDVKKLAAFRKARGMSLAQLAQALHVQEGTLEAWLRLGRKPRELAREAIRRFLVGEAQ